MFIFQVSSTGRDIQQAKPGQSIQMQTLELEHLLFKQYANGTYASPAAATARFSKAREVYNSLVAPFPDFEGSIQVKDRESKETINALSLCKVLFSSADGLSGKNAELAKGMHDGIEKYLERTNPPPTAMQKLSYSRAEHHYLHYSSVLGYGRQMIDDKAFFALPSKEAADILTGKIDEAYMSGQRQRHNVQFDDEKAAGLFADYLQTLPYLSITQKDIRTKGKEVSFSFSYDSYGDTNPPKYATITGVVPAPTVQTTRSMGGIQEKPPAFIGPLPAPTVPIKQQAPTVSVSDQIEALKSEAYSLYYQETKAGKKISQAQKDALQEKIEGLASGIASMQGKDRLAAAAFHEAMLGERLAGFNPDTDKDYAEQLRLQGNYEAVIEGLSKQKLGLKKEAVSNLVSMLDAGGTGDKIYTFGFGKKENADRFENVLEGLPGVGPDIIKSGANTGQPEFYGLGSKSKFGVQFKLLPVPNKPAEFEERKGKPVFSPSVATQTATVERRVGG